MARPEQSEGNGQLPPERFDPNHFYAAYIFDNPETRLKDVSVIVKEAQQLRYRVRYWWLSDAMDLQDAPDRLIVCVHHPSAAPEAGMNLDESLQRQQIVWDDLEGASVYEYRDLGKPVKDLHDIGKLSGLPLFPRS